MCIGILPACVYVHHVCDVPTEARRGAPTPGTGVRRNWVTIWVLETEPSGTAVSALAVEPFLQPYEASLFKEMPSSVSFSISFFRKFICLFVCACSNVCVCLEARGQSQMFDIVFERGSFGGTWSCWLAWLVSEPQWSLYLYLLTTGY